MSFQFHCPKGCLLEAEPAQIGQSLACPICGSGFIVPNPSTPATETGGATEAPPGTPTPTEEKTEPKQPSVLGSDLRKLHFACPSGHWVEAPRELVGQHASCPYCNVEFVLAETNSREFQEHMERLERRRDAKIGNAWLSWAIFAAIVVVGGLLLLLIRSQLA